MEIEDIANNLLRIERKLDVLLAMQNLWVNPETLEIKEIEEDEKEENNNNYKKRLNQFKNDKKYKY